MSIFKPIVSFLQWAALEVSKADGKPGLSVDDFKAVLSWVRSANGLFASDGKTPLTGAQKNARVTEWIISKFGSQGVLGQKVSDWTARLITWAAYLIAKRNKQV